LSRLVWLIGLLAMGMAIFAVAPSAMAQESGGVINAIRIDGNQRIEASTVQSYMLEAGVAVGDPFDNRRINRSLKNLFATGLFADVNMVREGNTLVVRVVENPIINRIAFEGNQRVKDEVLETEVELRARVVYTRTKVQTDVARIVEIYRRSGRFAATVEPKIIQLPQNRVDLVFEIDEGPQTDIRDISFIGNTKFNDSRLRDEVSTKESAWYRFLTSDDTYDPDRIAFDRDRLRTFYLSKGYADFRVLSAIAELTRDRSGFFITFTVEEGERYTFGEVGINSQLRDLATEQLFEDVTTVEGDWYDASKVENSIQDLTERIGNLGFAFVDIRPRTTLDRENRIVKIDYEIAEGQRVFVERINVNGNSRTLDEVVRREFRLVEGDAFNAAKLRRSEQRIRNLGFFGSVALTQSQGSSGDKAVIDVEVSEMSTGALTFQAGISSSEGVLGSVSITERNLLGRGQNLGLSFTLSGRTQLIDLRFTEPYFLGREIAAGFDIFSRESDLTNEGTFDENQLGFVLRGGYPITESLNHALRYRLQRSEIADVDLDASPFIKFEAGTRITSSLGHSLIYDVRDSRFDPTEGYFTRFDQDVAGFGGNARYLKHEITGTYYHPINEFLVGSLSATAGNIFGFGGEDVRLDERFFVGGRSLRGFTEAGIGPRDVVTDDPLGGNSFVTGKAELSFPIDVISGLDLRGVLFGDVGTLTGIDVLGANLRDEASLRSSLGIGISFNSPMGPIRMDWAVPVQKESFDQTELFQFNFGTRF
jgi:outer membrane protein insertion porin family